MEHPHKARSDRKRQKEPPANSTKYDIEGHETTPSVDQGNTQSQQYPTDHIVANTRGQSDDADWCRE